MNDESGNLTIQTLFTLILISAFALGAFIILSNSGLLIQKAQKSSVTNEGMKYVPGMIAVIEADVNPEADSIFDGYRFTEAKDDGWEVSVNDVSSKINPNWVRPTLFQDTLFSSLLKSTSQLTSLEQMRVDTGFELDIAAYYKDIFTKEAFDYYLSPYSYPNLNCIDEFAFERFILDRSSDSYLAKSLRNRLRSKLIAMEMVREEEFDNFLGNNTCSLNSIFTLEGQINVNTADPYILEGLIRYPAYGLTNASDILQRILQRRSSGEISKEALYQTIGVDRSHRLYSYLGVKTYFWSIQLKKDNAIYEIVLARKLKMSSIDPKKTIVFISCKQVEHAE